MSLFAEEVVESEETETEEVAETESVSDETESVKDEEEVEEEDEEKEDERYVNVRSALQQERGKRREAEKVSTQNLTKAESYREELNGKDDQLKSIKAQIKELGLDDTIKIEEVAPEIRKLRERERAEELTEHNEQMMSELHTEVMGAVGDFKNIDVKSDDQGVTLTAMILSGVSAGQSIEEATQESLERLNRMVGKKTVPMKTKKKTVKSAPRQANTSAIQKLKEKATESGKASDWDKYFLSME